MNNKGESSVYTLFATAGFIVFIPLLVFLALSTSGCNSSTQEGKSIDYVYGYDTGMVWNHLYLTNDHTTTYCYTPEQSTTFGPIFEQAIKENKKVEVGYSKYVGKGALCQGQPQGAKGSSETVVVTNVVLR